MARNYRMAGSIVSYRRGRRSNPRWLTVRYAGTCAKCEAPVPKGSEAFYYPDSRAIYCPEHSEAAAADYSTMTQYEEGVTYA